MVTLKLALRNLLGAGLRTWLNVIVLSMSYVMIIFNQGILKGWDKQATRDTIAWEIGGGQYWHQAYDPFDPFTIIDSHGVPPKSMQDKIRAGELTPILVSQATIYPEGRIQSVLLKGIDPQQKILSIPTGNLATEIDEIPAVIGTRMARNTKLTVGDYVTVRWRDVNRTFDAAEMKIVGLMKTSVGNIDAGQMWIPINRLRAMLQMPGEATLLVTAKEGTTLGNAEGWVFKDLDYLLQDLRAVLQSKSIGGSIFYTILLLLAMLAIFDTQVFSIFRRRKEIGTLIALGMTRNRVIRMFTMEGAIHGILAALLAAVWGIPLLGYVASTGWAMPQAADDFGMSIAERIYPYYSIGLVAGTALIVMIAVTIVSFIPTRRIAKLKPTDAIRGKTS
jgi:putative ABC transport system permease protein